MMIRTGTIRLAWLLLAAITVMPAAARAQQSVETQPIVRETTSGPSDLKSDGWLRMFGSLAVVVVLVLVARRLLRRAGGLAMGGTSGPVEIVARMGVSMRQQILLVRLGRKLLLVGGGSDGLRTLCEVTDEREVSELLAAARAVRRPLLGRRTDETSGSVSGESVGGGKSS